MASRNHSPAIGACPPKARQGQNHEGVVDIRRRDVVAAATTDRSQPGRRGLAQRRRDAEGGAAGTVASWVRRTRRYRGHEDTRRHTKAPLTPTTAAATSPSYLAYRATEPPSGLPSAPLRLCASPPFGVRTTRDALFVAALLFAAPALAATGDSLSLGHAAIRSVASLALVVALILAASVAARRWLGRIPAGGHRNPIQIIASRALGSRATITMLEVEGERLLVGSSPHGLGLICKLGDAPADAEGDGRFDRLLADESVRRAR